MSVTIKFRKGNASEWTANGNVVLASGEPGYELDTGRLKIGNGVTIWNNLPYSAIVPSGFIAGSGISLNLANNGSSLTINSSGATISNYGDNRVLTSDGTSTGINGESNLTFNGSLLSVSGDLIANTGTLNRLIFNTSLDDPDLLAGQLQWNSTEGTLDLGLNDSYAMHLGEELLYRVRNVTGSTLLAGSPVYASGLSPGGNNRIEVGLYAADGNIREIRFMGLITEDLPNNGTNGYATQFGYIRGIDTRGNAAVNGTTNKLWTTGEPAWNQGDILYVHPSVPGKLTKIEPKHSISVAIITNVASNGKIFVRPTSYGHLNDNHDVNVSGVTNGQFLQYNSLTDYWVPSSSGNFTTLQVNGTNVSVSGHTHTPSDITNFNSTVSGLLPTIANSGDNRVLTSTGTTTGINGESNLTFDGTSLKVGNPNPAIVGALVVNGNIVTAAQSVQSSIFSIYGNTNNRLEFQNNSLSLTTNADSVNHAFPYFSGSSRINRMIITSSGVGIGTDIPVSRLDVSGIITASGGNSTNWNTAHSWGNHATAGYAPLNSPSFTGTPLAPTATSGTNTTQIATTAFVRTEITNLVASAPSTLDTLNELASALGNDPNFATTVTNSIAGKVSKSGDTMTGTLNAPTGIFSGNVQISSQTASTIAGFDSNKNVTSLSTTTYPSLTELSYVKGVTSNIQTQLNSKQSTLTNPVTGTGTINYVSKWTGSTTQGNGIIIDNGTNVGIGTGTQATSPPERLVVDGNLRLADTAGSSSNRLQLFRGGGGAYDYTLSKEGNHLAFSTSNDATTNRFTQFGYHSGSTWVPKTVINNFNGFVGINITSPSTVLEVAATGTTSVDIAHFSNSNGIEKAKVSLSSTGDGVFSLIDGNNITDILLSSHTGTNSYINAGRLGIGTTTPSGTIHIVGTGIVSSISGVSPNALWHVYSSGSGDTVLNIEGTNGSLFSVVDNLSGSLMSVNNNAGLPIFEVFSDDSIIGGRFGQNDWVISSGGNVGIGTGIPSFKLHVIGTGNFTQNLLVNGTGVSISGHTHTSSDIANFNSVVSGLLPVVANSGDNRLLTSTGTSTGVNAESNATFDGTTLAVNGAISVDNLRLDGNTLSSTSGNIVINPSGTGALQRDSGGNARGQYAVDWQTVRSSGTMVAGGDYSVIGGGKDNISSGSNNTVGGGYRNTSSGYASTVGGGKSNTSSGFISTVGGGQGNTSSGNYSTVGGGRYNTSSSYSTVGGGQFNISSGFISTVGGGQGNTSSGYVSTVGGGTNNIASGDYSAILGGQFNNANHNNVFILGSNITSTQPNTTFVENLDVAVSGDIDTLKINKFFHNNLAVASGLGNDDLLIAIINPTGTATTEVIQGSVLRSSLLNQPAQLQFRQGTDVERLLITPASGEPIWTTDSQRFYIGDGTTVGGDFVGPSPYDRSSGTQSIVALNTDCVARGDYSVVMGGRNNTSTASYGIVGGGLNNLALSSRSSINGGANNVAAQKVRRANSITTSTNTITVLNATAADFDNTTADALQIRYRAGALGEWTSTTRTVNTATQSGNDVILVLTTNVGAVGTGWINVTVINTAETDIVRGQVIGGGTNNISSGTESVVGGGRYNTSSNYSCTVGGGLSNTSSGNYSTVSGGRDNTSSGTNSTVSGGRNNTSSGTNSTVGGGRNNTSSGNYSTVGGGYTNSATGIYSTIPGGFQAKATRYGELSHAAGRFSQDGDAQHTTLIARRLTTNATANQVLFLDNSSTRLIIPAETTWAFTIKLSAYNDTDNEGGWWIFRGGIRRNAANGTALIGSLITESGFESSFNTASTSVVADDTNEALEIRVTGVASKNIRWVAVVDISQVSYGTP